MTEKETYADKINKLLLKAESTTPEEAELLMAKAQELMTKYAIDEAMIAAAAGKSPQRGDVIRENLDIVGKFRIALVRLAYYILLVNDCKAVLYAKAPPVTIDGKVYKQVERLEIVGFKSDIEAAKLLFASLNIQSARAMASWWKENEDRYLYARDGGHLHKRQFILSFSNAAYERLLQAKHRGQASAKEEHGSGMELVLRDRNQMVLEKYNELYPDLTSSKQRLKGGDMNSHQAGHAAGQKADIGDPKLGGTKKQIAR